MIALTHLCVHRAELVSTYDAVLYIGWDWVTVGGYGCHEGGGGGGDVDVSPPSSVASERQQGLPFPFCHWLFRFDQKPCGAGGNQ